MSSDLVGSSGCFELPKILDAAGTYSVTGDGSVRLSKDKGLAMRTFFDDWIGRLVLLRLGLALLVRDTVELLLEGSFSGLFGGLCSGHGE